MSPVKRAGGPRGQRGQSQSVTRADVAREAGVSTAVVSYVVNGGPKSVSPATAERVRGAIERLGYQPNGAARALKLGRTSTLALIMPGTANPYFAEFALEIERAAADRGMVLIMANSRGERDLENRLVADLSARQVDGLIVFGPSDPPETLTGRFPSNSSPRPIVYVDAPHPRPDHHTLCSDTERGAHLAVEHLVQVHDHQSVSLIIGETAPGMTDGRESGWRQALEAAGLPEGELIRAPFTREGGYQAGLQALRGNPTALFVSNDYQAIGLLRAAHELGVDIPGQVAVVSYDGTVESEYCWPPLTTVRQRMDAMADAAVATVLGQPGTPSHQVFPVDLVVRGSCGCKPTVTGADSGDLLV